MTSILSGVAGRSAGIRRLTLSYANLVRLMRGGPGGTRTPNLAVMSGQL